MSGVILESKGVTKRSHGQRSQAKKFQGFFKKYGWGYAFILPSVLVFAIFTLAPAIWALLISFQHYFFRWNGQWVGFKNYVNAFTFGDGVFVKAIENTLYYTALTVTANILIALALAGLLQKCNKFWRTFFLGAYYLPAVTSAVIIAISWRWIYNGEFGLFNYLIGLLHIPPVRWLSDPHIVLNSISLSTILTVPATGVVLFNAAMGGVPAELYEAAKIDGAGGIRQWWHITLPLIKPTTLYLVVIYTIYSFQVFDKVYVMLPSGVADSAQFIVTQIYQNGFVSSYFGIAAAQGFILLLMIASVAFVQFRLLRTDVEY